MSVKYGMVRYARDRLCGSIVSHNNRPVLVAEIGEDGVAEFLPVGGRAYDRAPYGELDLTPVPLGNINHKYGVSYACRMPKRRDWRQGLRSNNFHNEVVGNSLRVDNNTLLAGPDLANTIRGKYPTVQDCMDMIGCGEANAKAFSRNFSITRYEDDPTFYLLWKVKGVGTISLAEDNTVRTELSKPYEYLSEMLGQEMNLE